MKEYQTEISTELLSGLGPTFQGVPQSLVSSFHALLFSLHTRGLCFAHLPPSLISWNLESSCLGALP